MKLIDTLKPRLRGRKIVKVIWNEFDTGRHDGHGKKIFSTDPEFYLDDGSCLRFVTVETEIGEYGIDVCLYKPEEK